jgi:hypothetical protein
VITFSWGGADLDLATGGRKTHRPQCRRRHPLAGDRIDLAV